MAILFDFDGTLADTLPDLLHALNNLLQKNELPKVQSHELRPLISFGSKEILRTFFKSKSEQQIDILVKQFLEDYTATNYIRTLPFPGVTELLNSLSKINIPWGIVTNRHSSSTNTLLEKFNLKPNKGCVVACDNTKNPKPNPEPLLIASKLLDIAPSNCLYIGDAKNDITAGNHAGMSTITAMFGYIPNIKSATEWPANFQVNHVTDIFPLVLKWHKQQNLLDK